MFQGTYVSVVASGTSPKAMAFHQGTGLNHLENYTKTHAQNPTLEILNQPPSSLTIQRSKFLIVECLTVTRDREETWKAGVGWERVPSHIPNVFSQS